MKYLSTILFLFFAFTTQSADQIYITKGNVQAVPIAVNSFAHNDSKMEIKFASETIEIIKNEVNNLTETIDLDEDAMGPQPIKVELDKKEEKRFSKKSVVF